MILVDTSVWVRALRRRASQERQELDHLLSEDQVATTDLIVAEVLQGARSDSDFRRVAERFEALNFFHADSQVWLRAATLSFDLKRRGLTTALSDVVIATVALEHDLELYTIDSDFERISGLRLHEVKRD
jgi:predicted nucleic acid-binding protein